MGFVFEDARIAGYYILKVAQTRFKHPFTDYDISILYQHLQSSRVNLSYLTSTSNIKSC